MSNLEINRKIILIHCSDVSGPEDFEKFVFKNEGERVFSCGLCYEFSHRTKYCVVMHVESKHFPNTFSYTCQVCEKVFHTKKAFQVHKNRDHKNENLF